MVEDMSELDLATVGAPDSDMVGAMLWGAMRLELLRAGLLLAVPVLPKYLGEPEPHIGLEQVGVRGVLGVTDSSGGGFVHPTRAVGCDSAR